MDPRSLKQLCENAARSLAGFPVEVRLQRPVVIDYDGQCYNTPTGTIIDIDPALSDANFFWVLTHEIGHAFHRHPNDIDPSLPPASRKLTPIEKIARDKEPRSVSRENQAERQAEIWRAYAERNYKNYSGWSDLAKKLRCLGGYVPPELASRVQKIGAQAGIKSAEVIAWQRRQEEAWQKFQEKLAKKGR